MAQVSFNTAASSTPAAALGQQLLALLESKTPDLAALQKLVTAGADLEQRNAKGETPLLHAARGKKEAAFGIIVKAKPDLSARTPDNLTAMFYALAHYNQPMVKGLLQNGLDPERDVLKGGLTALMWAANLGRLNLATLITEYGGDPYRKNTEDGGSTAIDYASKKPFIQQSMETIYKRKAGEREKAAEAEKAKAAQALVEAEQAKLASICKQGLPTTRKIRGLHPPKFKSA